jgi:hypothetical protein
VIDILTGLGHTGALRMLHPDDRCLLSEQVLPPDGYTFSEALICTYS